MFPKHTVPTIPTSYKTCLKIDVSRTGLSSGKIVPRTPAKTIIIFFKFLHFRYFKKKKTA
ncbi:hypothetical protein C2G38_167678 [Gigaspora rosea]|uniref:Uncharacterized protein n=1 Tax=Gigaspora rosea TaxID=44941 RepID=A0A397W0K6_9GLOM|nr:hypothetical protein C2G38_167678 [Gigaspora rosea]